MYVRVILLHNANTYNDLLGSEKFQAFSRKTSIINFMVSIFSFLHIFYVYFYQELVVYIFLQIMNKPE